MPAQICAVIAEESVSAAREAMTKAAAVADLIELRLDYLTDFDFSNLNNLRSLLEHKPVPVIITCRAIEEGGKQQIEERTRLRLLVEGARSLADYCDIEAAHYGEAASLNPDASRLIVSYHNFDQTPADLNAVYDRVTALPAAVHKIVTQAGTITDSLDLFSLLDRAKRDSRKLIALAMGEPGLMTRVLGPSRGCFLTYGSLVPGRGSASGQVTCEQLVDLYRVRKLSRDTVVTGLIGWHVAQSASPEMHNRAFAACNLDFVYIPFKVDDLTHFFRRFVRPETRELDWNLRGLSVTIPHKTAAMPLLDQIDETASGVGAVNTVVVDGAGLSGYNTDVAGGTGPLERVLKLAGESVGVIGAGGAARALIYGLLKRGARVTVFARDIDKAKQLRNEFGVSVTPIESFGASDVRIVINATPIGMRGHSEGSSPVDAASLQGRRAAYDLVYNPAETRFLRDARAQGCRTIGGLEMLVAQAALQFELWTGHQAPIGVMRSAASPRIEE